jgi:hypothetical protein
MAGHSAIECKAFDPKDWIESASKAAIVLKKWG